MPSGSRLTARAGVRAASHASEAAWARVRGRATRRDVGEVASLATALH
jgi:hypothetical protein